MHSIYHPVPANITCHLPATTTKPCLGPTSRTPSQQPEDPEISKEPALCLRRTQAFLQFGNLLLQSLVPSGPATTSTPISALLLFKIVTIRLFGVQAWVWSFVFCQLLFGLCGFRHQSLEFRVGYGPLFGSVLYQVIRFARVYILTLMSIRNGKTKLIRCFPLHTTIVEFYTCMGRQT